MLHGDDEDDLALPDYTFSGLGDSDADDADGANGDGALDKAGQEEELFVLEQLAWEPSAAQGRMIAIGVAKDTILCATDKRCIIQLKTNGDTRVFLIKDSHQPIHKLFVDAQANHLFVTMKNGLNYYFQLTADSSRPTTQLSKLKG
jgi:hypothetical protein